MMSKSKASSLFHDLLVQSVNDDVKNYDKVGLLLSGGVDSLGVLFALQELDKDIQPYTFYLDKAKSPDLHMSKKVCELYGYDLIEIPIPRENIKQDILYLIKNYNCKTKVSIETNLHMLYTFPKIKEKVITSGLFSGTLLGTAKYEVIAYRNDPVGFNENRIKVFNTYDNYDLGFLKQFGKEYDIDISIPYWNKDILDFMLQFSHEYLNKPFQKWIIINGFKDKFKETGIRKERPYQIASGMKRYCETLLDDKEFNFNNRTRMLDVYRDWVKKYEKKV